MAVVKADEFWPEAERESQHFHARPPRDQEMAKFVKENDDREHEQERDDVADEPMAQRIESMYKKLGHPIPLNPTRRLYPQPSRLPLRQFEARGWQHYIALYGQQRWRHQRRSTGRGCLSGSSPPSSPPPVARWRQI